MGLFAIYGRGILMLGAIMLISDYLGYRNDGEFSDLFKKLNPYLGALVVAWRAISGSSYLASVKALSSFISSFDCAARLE